MICRLYQIDKLNVYDICFSSKAYRILKMNQYLEYYIQEYLCFLLIYLQLTDRNKSMMKCKVRYFYEKEVIIFSRQHNAGKTVS